MKKGFDLKVERAVRAIEKEFFRALFKKQDIRELSMESLGNMFNAWIKSADAIKLTDVYVAGNNKGRVLRVDFIDNNSAIKVALTAP